MKETDAVLGSFSREVLPHLSDHDLSLYEELLGYGDPTLWLWVSHQSEVPADIKNDVLDRLMIWCEDWQRRSLREQESQ